MRIFNPRTTGCAFQSFTIVGETVLRTQKGSSLGSGIVATAEGGGFIEGRPLNFLQMPMSRQILSCDRSEAGAGSSKIPMEKADYAGSDRIRVKS